uniref:AAA domain-containing protein n=1 Tax=Macrostomum lignano TaxID=282301 RepID=A0A1I8H051_9PLAT
RSEQAPPSAATPARRLWLCPDDDLGRQAADRASEERSQLWTDRYGPASTEELCLHKKKLLELEACLSCRPRLVFVHGPCGAGKSVAVRLLCDRLRLGSAYLDEELDACANGPAEAMQALIRLARFRQARVIVWDEPTLSLSFADQQQQQLKFGSSSGDTAALRALLDEFLARCLDVCLVLISCNDRLLPRDWLEDNNATLVQVNPVARTQLIRSLNAILTKRHLRPASYNLACNSRYALLASSAGSVAKSVLFRDTPYQLFHAVGKLLHAKRVETAPGSGLAPLVDEPEVVSERCSLPVDLLLSFVQANAAVHFSSEAVEPLARMSDDFSLADRLSAAWTTESDAKPQAISLASRSLVCRLVGSNRAPNRFLPIRKPHKLPPAATWATAAAARTGVDAFYTPACLRSGLAASARSAAAARSGSGGAQFVICPEPDLELEATIEDDDD